MPIILKLVFVLFLVLLNGFFVAAEFAIVKVRKTRLETLEKGKAKHTLNILSDLNSYLSACQLGITLASLGLGWIGEPAVAELLEPIFSAFSLPPLTVHTISFLIAFTFISGLHIVLGELAPKTLAIVNSEAIALNVALPLILFYKITYPIIWLFNKSTNGVLRLIGLKQIHEEEVGHTDEEIKLLVEESYKQGLIDQTELTFVDNIFNFSEKTAKEIMVPRTDMICFYEDTPIEEMVKVSLEEQITRYPIGRNDKDHIIGFVHLKDLFKAHFEHLNDTQDIIRDVLFVPETVSISALLKTLQQKNHQMAIVIDEYGGTAGMITIEDILEEIVGEIRDEFDDEIPPISKIDENTILVDGMLNLNDLSRYLALPVPTEEVETVGGWVYSQLAETPRNNQKINYENYEFIVHNCNPKRIHQLLVKKIS